MGNGSAASNKIKYYLSADQELELSSDLFLGVFSVNALASNAVLSINNPIEIPSTTLPNQYYIIFFIDGDRVVAEIDEDNNDDAAVSIEVLSINAPRITSVNFPDVLIKGTEDILFGITAEDDVGLSTTQFNFKGITETEWKTRDLEPFDGSYELTLPDDDFDDMRLEYYFRIFNLSGISTRSETGYTYLKTLPDGEVLPNLNFGKLQSDYNNIIAVPFDLTSNAIAAALEDDLGPYTKSKWRLFHYVNDETGILEYQQGISSFEPGKGYWLISAEETVIDTGEGVIVRANADQPFIIDLAQGWNQIGNPFNHTLFWTDVLAFNGEPSTLGTLRLFDSGNIGDSDRLEPFQGAFLFSDQDQTLLIPVTQNINNDGSRKKSEYGTGNSLEASNWQVMFRLTQNGRSSLLGGIGMHEEATSTRDRYDRIALPGFSFLTMAQFNFSHPEFFYQNFSTDVVTMISQYRWEGSIQSSLRGQALLTWDNTYFGENDYTILMHDLINNTLLDLRKVSSYSFPLAEDHKLEFYYRLADDISSSVIPKQVSVDKAYLNPFNQHITIPVSLPGERDLYQTLLVVYNTIGAEVHRQSQQLSPGFQQLQWSLPSHSSQMRSGLYIYRLEITSTGYKEVFTGNVLYIP